MQETLSFLGILDSAIKRNHSPAHPKAAKERMSFRRNRFPYSKAVMF
jgi:hypothetical protein